MQTRRVLIVSNDAKLRESLPAALLRECEGLEAEATGRVSEALLKIASTSYDVLVCTVEAQDELACLIRVKKANRSLPVVVLTKPDDPKLATLSRYIGANLVLPRPSDLGETSEALARAIETHELNRETRAYVLQARERVREVRRLRRETRELVSTAMGLAAASDQRQFFTLLVEDDVAQAVLLTRTLARSGIPPFVRTAESAEAAQKYLSGEGPYGDRSRHPLPSLVISDLILPGKSGLDLLRWIRNESSLRHVGFIMLTGVPQLRDVEQAYADGTNFFLVKSETLAEVADLVKQVYTQCMVFKTGLGY